MSKRQLKGLTVERLERLLELIEKNRDVYYRAIEAGREVSGRMYGWFDEYDSARGSQVWGEYCDKHQMAMGHKALDILA